MKPASVAPQILEQLKRISTATLTSQLFKLGFRNTYLTGVKPLNPALRMAGEAVTVRFVPAREDLATFEAIGKPGYPQRKAIDEILPGQGLVLDCRNIDTGAAGGEILMARPKARGAAGAATGGARRDEPPIPKLG